MTAMFCRASNLSRLLSCLHGQRHYFVIHGSYMMCVPSLPESGKFLLVESKTLESRIRLWESGIPLTIDIRNPSSTDKHLEAVPGIRNTPRGTDVTGACRTNMLARLFCFLLEVPCKLAQFLFVLFIHFFSFYTFLFYPRHHDPHPQPTTLAFPRPTAHDI